MENMEHELVLCIGPVCSGKTTWSKKYTQDNTDAFRFCFDEFLYMCKGNGVHDRQVMDTAIVVIFSLLMKNDVVVDGFPLDFDNIEHLVRFSKNSSIRIFDVGFAESVVRSVNRKERNGRFVHVDEMRRYYNDYKNFLKSGDFATLYTMTEIIPDESSVNLSLVM